MAYDLFFERQNINDLIRYTKRLERLHKEFCKKYHLDTPVEALDIPVPMIIVSDDIWSFTEVVVQDESIIERPIIEGEAVYVLEQQSKYCERINKQIRQDLTLREELDEFRTSWGIPIGMEQENFLKYLIGDGYDLYLPGIIRTSEFKEGIEYFCEKFRMRKKVPEEFGMMAAIIMFGDFMENDVLHFFSIQTTRLFKVIKGQEYSLYLEIKPTITRPWWDALYRETRRILKEPGFVPVNGNIGVFSELIKDAPEQFGECLVLPISAEKWREDFNSIRSYLDREFGENYLVRKKEPNKKTKFVIEKLIEYRVLECEMSNRVFKEISHIVLDKFGDHDDASDSFTYTEHAVRKVYHRHRSCIEEKAFLRRERI